LLSSKTSCTPAVVARQLETWHIFRVPTQTLRRNLTPRQVSVCLPSGQISCGGLGKLTSATTGAAVVPRPNGAFESPSARCGSQPAPLLAREDAAVPASTSSLTCGPRAQHQPQQWLNLEVRSVERAGDRQLRHNLAQIRSLWVGFAVQRTSASTQNIVGSDIEQGRRGPSGDCGGHGRQVAAPVRRRPPRRAHR